MMILVRLVIFFWISDICNAVDHEGNFNWTPEIDAIVLGIFRRTDTGEVGHQDRMKKMWDKRFPNFQSVTGQYLHQHALMLLQRGVGNKRGYINWTRELDSDLVEVYEHILRSHRKGLIYKLHSEFYGKHPNVRRMTPESLWRRAKISYDRYRLGSTAVKLRNRIPWTGKHVKDALRIYHEHPTNHKNQAMKLHEAWMKLYPEYKEIPPHALQRQMRILARQAGEDLSYITRHKWTREQNADLLHIYHRMNRDTPGYTRRLRELWKRMNMDLRHMDGEYLRKRLHYLISKHYEPTKSEMEQARIKFNSLPLPEPSEDHKDRRIETEFDKLPPPDDINDHVRSFRELDKGKEKIEPQAEQLTTPALRTRTPRTHQFYNFMSVNESHRRSSGLPDENVGNPYVASSSHTSHDDRNTSHNHLNFHHGETSTSNPTSHQQSNSRPCSPSQSSPKEFFNFF